MYANALEFLEDERAAWRPYEALLALSDADLSVPLDGAHGWGTPDATAIYTIYYQTGTTITLKGD